MNPSTSSDHDPFEKDFEKPSEKSIQTQPPNPASSAPPPISANSVPSHPTSTAASRAWWYSKVDQLDIRKEQLSQKIKQKRKEVEDANDLLKDEKLETKNLEDRARELVKERCVKKGEVESARESVIKLGMEMKILETDIFNLQRSLNK